MSSEPVTEFDNGTGRSGYLTVLILLVALAGLFLAVYWIVLQAREALPQEDEIISVTQAAEWIQEGRVERILIQEDRDIFLYLPGRARPFYTQLAPGQTFTETMQSLGVPPSQFPPLIVEPD